MVFAHIFPPDKLLGLICNLEDHTVVPVGNIAAQYVESPLDLHLSNVGRCEQDVPSA